MEASPSGRSEGNPNATIPSPRNPNATILSPSSRPISRAATCCRNTSVKADVLHNHKFIHVQFCAHILNLIVVEGLKEIDDSITKVRNIVRYVRASPQRLSKFKAIASQLGISCSKTLCLDVPTRWNSTYIMLDVVQKYQRAFEWMEVENGGLKYALLEPARKGLLSGMTMRMQAKYDKYWGDVEKINRLLFVAVILNTQYKLALIEFWRNYTMGVVKATWFITMLKRDLDELYSHYNNSGQPSSVAGTSHSIPTPLFNDCSSDDSLHPPRRGYNIVNQYHQLVAMRNIIQCTSEIEWYFMEEAEAPSDVFQLLTWWKVNSTKYQIISRIA
ncbi:zinc finger BED domain-containing protein RICESLEEPER 2-like [Carya illinoinensis]|uniref:zinc finger BED domain-containing protein RICESLEEPER 2-like n=1 Tax=Carya illinoinensis TaxID=32201 RepID=UPI001C721F42|nr:zinc finger BED domain-containing protein RICESLEEPER 2-like [Carya illinoinensis]